MKIEFSLVDTLSFKGVQVVLIDQTGNTMHNSVHLKQAMISEGIYDKGKITMHLGSRDKSQPYNLRIVYLNISGVNEEPFESLIEDN